MLTVVAHLFIILSMDLLKETYRLVDSSELKQAAILEGANVSSRWYQYFKNRNYKNPGVLYVQRVHDFLKAQQANDSESVGNSANASGKQAV